MILSVRSFFGVGPVIAAGATNGSDHFERVIARVSSAATNLKEELLVFLDFSEIEDATPSYIKETVLKLHQCGRRFAKAFLPENTLRDEYLPPAINLIVAILNASEAVQLCIHEVFARRGLAILAGSSLLNDRFDEAIVLGHLDEKGSETLRLACGLTEFQAGDLLEFNDPADPIQVTGWNNRLAELHRQRLLLRRTEGRTNRYRAFSNVIYYHGQILSR